MIFDILKFNPGVDLFGNNVVIHRINNSSANKKYNTVYSYNMNLDEDNGRYLVAEDKYNVHSKYLKNVLIYGIPETYGYKNNEANLKENILTNEGLLIIKITSDNTLYHVYDLFSRINSSDIEYAFNIANNKEGNKFEKELVLTKQSSGNYPFTYYYNPECLGKIDTDKYLCKVITDNIDDSKYNSVFEYGYLVLSKYPINDGLGAQNLYFYYKPSHIIQVISPQIDANSKIILHITLPGTTEEISSEITGNTPVFIYTGVDKIPAENDFIKIVVEGSENSPSQIQLMIK